MGEIRAFTEEHVTAVTGLFLRMMRGRSDAPGAALQTYFREIFFSNPWASPEIPPLVYFDQGKLVGFLGVIPRQMEFRGRSIRVAVTSQLVVDRAHHRGLASVELLRRFLRGPQDLSFCDGVTETVDRLWVSAGASPSRLYSFNWLRVLRPFGTARSFSDRLEGTLGLLGRAAAAGAAPLDFLASKVPHPALRPPRSACISTPVNAEELYRLLQEVGWRESLRPAYDLAAFQWLMSQVAANRPMGDLLMTAVRKRDGDLCGYYICQVQPGGHAGVLQIGVRRHDHFDQVLEALLRDAWLRGAVSVKGQAIPSALVNLTSHYCLFRQAHTCVLFHAKDPALADAILRGDAALSRLDGEYFLRFATERWT
jgi:hypothetical protein